ncbi:CDP-alcohol phosphatidyltransferase family protein [Butyrivibrio sp. FC2001]|uniref:CDP-alcohol phosphatidyltransferase family protein n=1 Tax=Butyrivibrio sp. FC2001 TaxID=1280671 RepID=UPI00040E47AF|nr:CDP-alcohol phosphatidyltransferase family protein [Butyrivibrio sp. FC2001]
MEKERKLIGVYDYTIILTYLSTISGALGIIITMTGIGHPYGGTLFLMASGLFDAFDGTVARTKKNRTDFEKEFGAQIDSLSDLICFGVLPASIGVAQLRIHGAFRDVIKESGNSAKTSLVLILLLIAVFYVLSALVRLAYFNATAGERAKQKQEFGREYYTGLPVTAAALIFPLTLIIHYFTILDLTFFYFFMLLLVGILFIGNFKIPKPGLKMILVGTLIGVAEFSAVVYILVSNL